MILCLLAAKGAAKLWLVKVLGPKNIPARYQHILTAKSRKNIDLPNELLYIFAVEGGAKLPEAKILGPKCNISCLTQRFIKCIWA